MAGLAYGLAIVSDIDLGLPTTSRHADLTVRRGNDPIDVGGVRWLEGDDDPYPIGRIETDYLLHFDDEVDLVVSGDGSAVTWHSTRRPSPTLVHLVLDHAIPYALMRRDRFVLHAACLVDGNELSYAMAGPSGRGKSTLAAAMLGRGHRLLADDCAAVELQDDGPRVVPSYPGLRLDRTSRQVVDLRELPDGGPVTRSGPKRRLGLPASQPWDGEGRHRLACVFVLVTERGCGEGPMTPTDALTTLLANSFHLTDDGRDRAALFERAAGLVETCPLWPLVYDQTSEGLAAAVEAIERRVQPAAGRAAS